MKTTEINVTINGQEVDAREVSIDHDRTAQNSYRSTNGKAYVEFKIETTIEIITNGGTDFPHVIGDQPVVFVNGNEYELDSVYKKETYTNFSPDEPPDHREKLVGKKVEFVTEKMDRNSPFAYF